ncbi:hypothetical protein M446_2603 [Methylobacterium sp. 4-46]|uniref:hypothetical protein n=1 Tax=unclassified Methylobacterium TaxID=2615210 RepID=UPI000165CAB7|nr:MULTISPECIES: hypothetical protein [Methylobacterium]ACA17042.1 hypothetical protein M446_2603 [Methylobacterium sp. 4-46]WFT82731.1 hypothetical protein QA634_13200 [Methylobacterium nodulans]
MTAQDQFKRQPRRKAEKGRVLTVSAEQKAAYEALMREKEEREAYAKHLPGDLKPR